MEGTISEGTISIGMFMEDLNSSNFLIVINTGWLTIKKGYFQVVFFLVNINLKKISKNSLLL
jgi:hypothetical protein